MRTVLGHRRPGETIGQVVSAKQREVAGHLGQRARRIPHAGHQLAADLDDRMRFTQRREPLDEVKRDLGAGNESGRRPHHLGPGVVVAARAQVQVDHAQPGRDVVGIGLGRGRQAGQRVLAHALGEVGFGPLAVLAEGRLVDPGWLGHRWRSPLGKDRDYRRKKGGPFRGPLS